MGYSTCHPGQSTDRASGPIMTSKVICFFFLLCNSLMNYNIITYNYIGLASENIAVLLL